ncbi:hypothetical protein [Rhodanobacter umsongensis]
MSREKFALCTETEVAGWYQPPMDTIALAHRERYLAKCQALRSVCLGEVNLTTAARESKLCRKQLRSMVDRASKLALDGRPFGFRVCVPWGSYSRDDAANDGAMPTKPCPHAMATMLAAQPQIKEWVHGFSTPLPTGQIPRKFLELHKKIVKELTRKDLQDFYPLNRPDKGKRALLRYIRSRRIETAPMPDLFPGESPQISRLAEIFHGDIFDRAELDGHRIDIKAELQVPGPNGGTVTRPVTALWWIPEVETESRAILSWVLRVGRNYNNQDVTQTMANSLQKWTQRDLITPELRYAPGAGMPSALPDPLGFSRPLLVALDNHKGHHSQKVEDAFCRAHDGILTFGRPHQPRTRPIVEQLNSRMEKGAFRMLPGGFEPATKLGEDKVRISDFSPKDHPIQLHLLEEFIDVAVANYNATPHPALGDISPLQFLQQRAIREVCLYQPSDASQCAADMNSVIVALKVVGNKKTGTLPHVNYAYVRYRGPDLEGRWELVGKTLVARVNRNDLRTLVLYRTASQPIGVLRASSPWDQTRHDETTRMLIHQWSKQEGGFSLKGVECAVTAYVNFLRANARTSQQAADQLAYIQHQHPTSPSPSSRLSLMSSPMRAPTRGWISMDDMRDS